jgi:glutaredoxin
MKRWKMETFTLDGCGYCEELKRGLLEMGIPYNDNNVTYNDFLGDRLEETYQCESYPMILLKEPFNKVWLPESSLLPSPNIEIFNSIPKLLQKINQIHKNEI